jgi:hypothetical protein
VSVLLVAVAATVVAGAIVAVTARVPRLAALGLLVVLVASPLLVEPPGPLPALTRIAGAALAGYLLWIALRDVRIAGGTLIGWPAEALAGVTGFVAGWLLIEGVATLSVEPTTLVAGPALEVSAGGGVAVALLVLGVTPVLLARDALRLGIGLLLLLTAADVGRRAVGLGGSEVFEVAMAITVAAVGGAIAWVCARTVDAGDPLVLPDDPRRSRGRTRR